MGYRWTPSSTAARIGARGLGASAGSCVSWRLPQQGQLREARACHGARRIRHNGEVTATNSYLSMVQVVFSSVRKIFRCRSWRSYYYYYYHYHYYHSYYHYF